ncbi:MAG: flavodoxin domain-containing protein [Candidatus Kerfeldbacteria bacterium]|nr:flavodoxin domain-containing protein [Candidatus Kerfeldbacteria bacterium]
MKMRVLIVYATNSSGTAEAARIVQDVLSEHKHKVVMQHARDTKPADLDGRDLVILGSCTWELFIDGKRLEGQLQQHMHDLAMELKDRKLPRQHFAVFALGDRGYTDFCQAADLLETLVHDVGGNTIIPTLRIDSWFFDLKNNRQRVLEWAGQLVRKLG